MTFIAGLRRSGLVAPWVLEGAMDGDAFKTYTAEILAPTLAPGGPVTISCRPTCLFKPPYVRR
ncbi:MAG: IS630 family transposase, partial [Proteobacteria bacterium]|nr:IS630 family transposase [Pseudomonadota bacterium]